MSYIHDIERDTEWVADDLLKYLGVDPSSKEAGVFKFRLHGLTTEVERYTRNAAYEKSQDVARSIKSMRQEAEA